MTWWCLILKRRRPSIIFKIFIKVTSAQLLSHLMINSSWLVLRINRLKCWVLQPNKKFIIGKMFTKVFFGIKLQITSLDIIEAVAVTPDNKFIISSSSDFSIKIFDIETKGLVYEFLHAHPSNQNCSFKFSLFSSNYLTFNQFWQQICCFKLYFIHQSLWYKNQTARLRSSSFSRIPM